MTSIYIHPSFKSNAMTNLEYRQNACAFNLMLSSLESEYGEEIATMYALLVEQKGYEYVRRFITTADVTHDRAIQFLYASVI